MNNFDGASNPQRHAKGELLYAWRDFSRLQQAALWIGFVCYAYMRFNYRWVHEIQGDEAVTVKGLSQSYVSWITNFIPTWDFHFHGAYLLLYPIGHFISVDKFIVGIPYILLSLLFYYLFARVNWARLMGLDNSHEWISSKWANVLACFLIAYNNTLIIYAFELRPYSVLCLLMLVALFVSWKIVAQNRLNVWLICYAFLIISFHNYGFFMLIVGLSYCVSFRLFLESTKGGSWIRRVGSYWPAVINLLMATVCSYPFFWLYQTRPVLRTHLQMNFDVHQYIHAGIAGAVQVMAIYYGFRSDFKWVRLIIVLLVACGVFLFIYQKKWAPILFVLILVIGPTYAIYLQDLRLKYWFIQRQFLWVIPFHAAFVGVAVHHSINLFCQLIQRRGR